MREGEKSQNYRQPEADLINIVVVCISTVPIIYAPLLQVQLLLVVIVK